MRSTRGYLSFAHVYSRKIHFSFTPKFSLIFVLFTMAIFQFYSHSYIISHKKSTAYKGLIGKQK